MSSTPSCSPLPGWNDSNSTYRSWWWLNPLQGSFVPAPGQGVMAIQTRTEDIERRKATFAAPPSGSGGVHQCRALGTATHAGRLLDAPRRVLRKKYDGLPRLGYLREDGQRSSTAGTGESVDPRRPRRSYCRRVAQRVSLSTRRSATRRFLPLPRGTISPAPPYPSGLNTGATRILRSSLMSKSLR